MEQEVDGLLVRWHLIGDRRFHDGPTLDALCLDLDAREGGLVWSRKAHALQLHHQAIGFLSVNRSHADGHDDLVDVDTEIPASEPILPVRVTRGWRRATECARHKLDDVLLG